MANLSYHYPLLGHTQKQKKVASFHDAAIDTLANAFLLTEGIFANKNEEDAMTTLISEMHTIFTTNPAMQSFITKNVEKKEKYIGSDIIEQLRIYKANILFCKNISENPQKIEEHVHAFLTQRQEFPLALRIIGGDPTDENTRKSLCIPEKKQAREILYNPIYTIEFRAIPEIPGA